MNGNNKLNNKFNSNNIYKLIKRAKDDNCISDDPIRKIIPNPIKFVYSFTLNSKNEPEKEEEIKNEESFKDIQLKTIKEQTNDKTKKLKNKNEGKQNYNNVNNNINDINLEKKFPNSINEKANENKNKNIVINYNNVRNNLNITNKTNDNNKNNKSKDCQKNKKKNNDKNIDFLNKKKNKNTTTKDNQSNNIKKKHENKTFVKNNLIHQIYNSKNISLWEESSDDDSNGQMNNQQNNILPIHKQIEFISKSKDAFQKPDIAKKSDYDKDLDKGKLKKIHKNKITFKEHKNYFQKISNKKINKLKK